MEYKDPGVTVHDLQIKVVEFKPTEGSNKSLIQIQFDGFVIIKRNGKLYKVRLAMSYDIAPHDLWPTSFNAAMSRFNEHAKQVRDKWKLVDNDTVEGINGPVIMQEPFDL